MPRTTLIFSLMLLFPCLCLAQLSLERQVIGSSGGFSSSGGINLSATTGEAVIQTASSGTIVLTQGFQQPDETGMVSRHRPLTGSLTYTLSPNPARDHLHLDLQADRNLTVYLRLFDLRGKEIPLPEARMEVRPTAERSFAIAGLAEGSYFLALFDEQGHRLATLHWQKW